MLRTLLAMLLTGLLLPGCARDLPRVDGEPLTVDLHRSYVLLQSDGRQPSVTTGGVGDGSFDLDLGGCSSGDDALAALALIAIVVVVFALVAGIASSCNETDAFVYTVAPRSCQQLYWGRNHIRIPEQAFAPDGTAILVIETQGNHPSLSSLRVCRGQGLLTLKAAE